MVTSLLMYRNGERYKLIFASLRKFIMVSRQNSLSGYVQSCLVDST